MRYFRYPNRQKNYNNALKEQYRSLSGLDKRLFRSWRRWKRFALIATFLVFCAALCGGFCLVDAITKPAEGSWTILTSIGKFLMRFLLLFVSGILAYVLTSPLWRKVAALEPGAVKRELYTKACAHLRAYYGLKEPYIVTKCFDAADPKFKNHDVCIFVANGELRITTDLVRGFLHGERDLGCYAFRKPELTLSKRQEGNQLMVELNTDRTVFVLGYRAKGFIEQHFLTPEAD